MENEKALLELALPGPAIWDTDLIQKHLLKTWAANAIFSDVCEFFPWPTNETHEVSNEVTLEKASKSVSEVLDVRKDYLVAKNKGSHYTQLLKRSILYN